MPFLAPLIPLILPAIEGLAAGIGSAISALGVGAGLALGGDLAGAGVAFGFATSTTLIGSLTFGSVLELGALAGVSALLAPHPKVNTSGSPQQFQADPNAPVPVLMGRYGKSINLVYETTSGGSNKAQAGAKGNEYLTSFGIISGLGPIEAFETVRFNDTILTFNGQTCNGGYIPGDEVQSYNPGYKLNGDGSYANNVYSNHAWHNTQLGALSAGFFSYPDKLNTEPDAPLPEWTTAHGFSSLAAISLTIVYDQTVYAGGVPQYQWVAQGIKLYDPRKDSTYPGGNGSHRWVGAGASAADIQAARATWEYTENPDIHALNYALGHFLPDAQTGVGRLYAGMGAGTAGVVIDKFIAAANVADANGWIICGQWTTGDGKWSTLTEMLKAGSATPVIDRGMISCLVDTPLTSLNAANPITADDLSGPIKLPTGSSFTARINTVFPRYSSEAHRWQMVQADTPVKAATYVTEDGAVRSKTLDWQYVPAVNQACQCAAYAITNGREISGIELPGKPKLRNYAVGDCLTIDVPEAGLATTKVMVTKRVTDPTTGGVTLTVRTETDAKHPYSLGLTGVAPATPGISGYDPTIVDAPLPDFWATGAIELYDDDTGESRSVVRITGSAADNVYAQTLDVRWRPVTFVDTAWTPTGNGSWSYRSFLASDGQFDLDLNPGSYDVQIAYTTVNGAYPSADEDWLDLGIETVSGSTSSNTANVGAMSSADVNAAVAQLQSDVAALQSGGDDPDVQAAQAAAAAAEAAEQGALNAEGLVNTYLGQVEGYANEVVTQTGLATQSADNSAASADTATEAAGSASDSAGTATEASLEAQVTGAATFPSAMSVPGFWTSGYASNPATPCAAGDSRFHVAGDGAPVFANVAPGYGDIIATAGTFVPAAGRTYTVTSTFRLKTAPTTVAHSYFSQSFAVAYTDETQNLVVGIVGLDSANLAVGQLQQLQSTFSYDGVKPAAWARPYFVAGALDPGPASDGVYEVLAFLFEDVTASDAAAGSAQAALTSEQNASASETAAQEYSATAGGAETAAVDAQNNAGDSAGAASGSEYNAGVSAGDSALSAQSSQASAGQAQTFAGDAETQAGYAEGSAASASGSQAAAAESAALVANYNPGANVVLNPTGSQGLVGWVQSTGASFQASPSDPGGPCFFCLNTSGAAQTINDALYQAQTYPVEAEGPYSLQVECISIGLSGGAIYAGIDWHIPGQPDQYSVIQPPENYGAWTRYTSPGVIAPAGATTATFYLQSDVVTFAPNAVLGFRKFKVELGAVCTPYTDDQVGAAITTQAEVAANATESVANRTDTLESTVNDPALGNEALFATATEQEGTLADIAGKTVAFVRITAASSFGQPATVEIDSGDGTGVVRLTAPYIIFGTGFVFDETTNTKQIQVGAHIDVEGGPFGSSNQFIRWFGPNMPLSSMTEANGLSWTRSTDGFQYFGGGLSAGTLTTKAGTSDTSVNAQAETAVFGSNGGTITVTLSYGYFDDENAVFAAGQNSAFAAAKAQVPNTVTDPSTRDFTATGNDPGGFQVDLYRSVNGSVLSKVASLTGVGNWNVQGSPPNSGDPGDIQYSDVASGSLTFTDPQKVAQNRQYQAVLVSRNPRYSGEISQNISIICVEQ